MIAEQASASGCVARDWEEIARELMQEVDRLKAERIRVMREREERERERNEAREVARLFFKMADRLWEEKGYEEDIEDLVEAPTRFEWLEASAAREAGQG